MQAPVRQPTAPVTSASPSPLPSRQSIRQDILAKKDVNEVIEYIERNESTAMRRRNRRKSDRSSRDREE